MRMSGCSLVLLLCTLWEPCALFFYILFLPIKKKNASLIQIFPGHSLVNLTICLLLLLNQRCLPSLPCSTKRLNINSALSFQGAIAIDTKC